MRSVLSIWYKEQSAPDQFLFYHPMITWVASMVAVSITLTAAVLFWRGCSRCCGPENRRQGLPTALSTQRIKRAFGSTAAQNERKFQKSSTGSRKVSVKDAVDQLPSLTLATEDMLATDEWLDGQHIQNGFKATDVETGQEEVSKVAGQYCPICQENWQVDDVIVVLPCGHRLHRQCCAAHAKKQRRYDERCPTCNERIFLDSQ